MAVTVPTMSRDDLERAKLYAETVRLQAETAKLNAEVNNHLRSATKMRVEYWLYPLVVGVSAIGAMVTAVRLLG